MCIINMTNFCNLLLIETVYRSIIIDETIPAASCKLRIKRMSYFVRKILLNKNNCLRIHVITTYKTVKIIIAGTLCT
jgi:hypothetical protein